MHPILRSPFELLYLIILFCIGLVCATSNALQADDGQTVQSLDGEWKFTTNFDPIASDWTTMTVPGNWDATDKYADHSGIGWYQRNFVPEPTHEGKQVRLRFDAVYHEAEVFLNRNRIGGHVGGYTPFEFDVTDELKYGEENTVTVRADNSYQRGAWWPWGGISRSVNLISNNELRIVWQHIRSEPNLKDGTANLFVRYRIVNAGSQAASFDIVSTLDNPELEIIKLSGKVPAGETKEFDGQAQLTKGQVRLWHFDRPQLYQLRTQLSLNGELQHVATDRFGIRKIEVKPTAILLNGEPMRLVGFNRVSDGMNFGNTEPDELVNLDVDLMKQCGATMSRIMHYPQAPNFLDRLDEKGMMVFCEIPVWQHDPQIITDNPITKQWLAEMINRDYNHPSIIGWSVGNEMRDFNPYASSMMKYVREELDPHRLVNFVHDRTIKNGADVPIGETDIGMFNAYNKWAFWMDFAAERWPTKPIFMSEFGLKQLAPDGKFREDFVGEWKKFAFGNRRVVGASLWTFNDYRSNFKGTQPTGFRTWGIVDENRNIKPAYYTLQKLYSPARQLSVDGRTVSVQARQRDEVPSYAMRGYKLEWKIESDAGETIQSGELELPDLKPGSDVWTGELPAGAVASEAQALIVSLVTPLGYHVHDTRDRSESSQPK